MAFLTYQFVEKNVRFQKSKLGCVGLLISLWLIGVAGYSIQQKNCYTNCGNEKSEKEKYSIDNSQKIWSTNGYTSKSCTAKYSTLNADFCLLQEQEKSPTALLVGDSHANHFYSALVTNKNLTGGNLLNLGSGGCFPFF